MPTNNLVLGVNVGDKVYVGDNLCVHVVDVGSNRAKVAFETIDPSVCIMREKIADPEVLQKFQEERDR